MTPSRMFSLLRKWFRRSSPDINVLVYTRKNCHLCTQAWETLTAYQKRRHFVLREIDVDTDRELVCQYGDCVPVVLINGEVRFRGRVNEVLLRRILDRA
jgi:glutaredoxin